MAKDVLNRKLKTLTAFRAMLVTVLLGSFFVFQIGYKLFPYPSAILYLIIVLYALTIIYSVLLGRVSSRVFAYVQLFLDASAATALIFFTGGIESWFSSLLIIIVIAAAMVADRRAGYIIATFSSILYGSLIDLQFYRILPIPYDPIIFEKDFLYNIFSHISALYLTAYLTGNLAERLKRKDIDYRDLSLFNREVIENTPGGLFTTDLHGRVLLINRAAEEISGTGRSEAIGENVTTIFPFIENLNETARMERTVELGSRRKIIGFTLSKMTDNTGRHTGFIGIFQDLTELRRMAAEIKRKEKLAAIGELSASIAHEIRNPLASLKSSVEMLREGMATAGQRERLMSIALDEMDRLNAIVTDFLYYSRPGMPEVRDFDLHGVLDETLSFLSKGNGAAISVRKNFSGSLFIKADPQKLRQVFWNLGLNAVESMPEGGELAVGTRREGDFVRITFRDTGKGIGPEEIENIFFPFFTTKKKGTGLGLSIAYRIIEDHNGTIKVRSRPERGTEFEIHLPAQYGGGLIEARKTKDLI